MESVYKLCSVLVIVLLCNLNFARSISLDEELTITYSQKVTLDKVCKGPCFTHASLLLQKINSFLCDTFFDIAVQRINESATST